MCIMIQATQIAVRYDDTFEAHYNIKLVTANLFLAPEVELSDRSTSVTQRTELSPFWSLYAECLKGTLEKSHS